MATFGSATPVSKIVTSAMPVFVGAGLRVAPVVLLQDVRRAKELKRRDWLFMLLIALLGIGMFGFSALMLYGMKLVSGVVRAIVMSTCTHGAESGVSFTCP